jgi:hypothetical protein
MLTSGAFGYITDYLVWWALYLSLIAHTWCFFRFFPRKTHRRAGFVVGNVLVFLCLLGTAAIIGESYFRFIAVHTDPFGVSLPARRWFALYTTTNSLGCRDKEWPTTKAAGVHRIAFFGDSFTYGWGIESPADRFTDLIQRKLDAAAPGRFEMMNVSSPGWSTVDQAARLPDFVEKYDVDEVVLCYVINDIEGLIPKSDDFNPTRPPEPTVFNPDSSCLLDYLYRRIYVPRVTTVRDHFDWLTQGYDDPATWGRQQESLSGMIDACHRANVRFRTVLLPDVQMGRNSARRERIHAQLSAFFQSREVELIDLTAALAAEPPQSLMVNALDAHPNARAHLLFAEAIWNRYYRASGS